MDSAEVGLEPTGPAGQNGRRRRWRRRLGAALVIVALLVAADSALGIGLPGEPGTIHVFGRDYNRYRPCCDDIEVFGHGPATMGRVKMWLGTFGGDPVLVHLEDSPRGWPQGFADPETTPANPPITIFLREGQDSYYPYVDASVPTE